jgi:hypothetical protein
MSLIAVTRNTPGTELPFLMSEPQIPEMAKRLKKHMLATEYMMRRKAIRLMTMVESTLVGATNMMNGNLLLILLSRGVAPASSITRLRARTQWFMIMWLKTSMMSYITQARERYGLYTDKTSSQI